MQSAIRVLKFGGTSMGSFRAMQRCAEIILGYTALPHHIPVSDSAMCDTVCPDTVRWAVVVSAVAGVTDALAKSCTGVASEIFADISRKHKNIIAECGFYFGLEPECIEQFCQTELDPLLFRLEQILAAASRADHALAECLAMGEKLSSCIFAFVLQQNLKNVLPQNPPMPVTVRGETLFSSDDNYLEARLDFAASRKQIKEHLYRIWQENYLPVIAGFTAADAEGRPTLLGRGGSDYSAAIVAAALELPTLDIWTDVAGIYSGDPRIVPHAKLWGQLDFSLVCEMAYSGAKVVHPKSISIALQNQVAVIVRSTFTPQEKGTLITPHPSPANSPKIAGFVLSNDNLLLHMENPNMLEGEGYIAQIAEVVHRQEIPIDVCATSETSFSFSIHHDDCNPKLLEDLARIGEIRAIRELYKLCCIGKNIGCEPRFVAELLLQCSDIRIQTISIGASHTNVTILFNFHDGVEPGSAAVELLQRLHAYFLEGDQESC
ncbi:MAG: aspartate kinase [Spirochaetota bacterium]